MYFTVLDPGAKLPVDARGRAYLVKDNWNDWNKFTTQYTLIICDSEGIPHYIGDVKIGQFRMKKDQQRPDIPAEFEILDAKFFSLGQDDTYYERLKERRKAIRNRVLTSLRDIAADDELFEKAKAETVTIESLLRSVTGVTVQGQFRRLAQGHARLTSYEFKYTGPKPIDEELEPVILSFEVEPGSQPPSNIHVLIGPNGVGKTWILEHMARAAFGWAGKRTRKWHLRAARAEQKC